jgi:hypothetical protein
MTGNLELFADLDKPGLCWWFAVKLTASISNAAKE